VGATNPFASPTRVVDAVQVTEPEDENGDAEEDEDAEEGAEEDAEEGAAVQQPVDDGPLMFGDDEYYDAMPQQDEDVAEVEVIEEVTEKRRPGRPRKSGGSLNSSQIQHTPPVATMASSRKRDRSTLEGSHVDDSNISHSHISETGRAQKKQRGGRASNSKVIVHQDVEDGTIDPSALSNGDDGDDGDAAVSQEPTRGRGKGKGKKAKAPKECDPNRAMGGQSSQVKLNDSPSKLRERREGSRSLSVGPISNVHLRASTPYEDAGRTSRFGRNLLQPLKYWANEMRIYKNGETAGIVRADPVSPPKRKKPPKKKGKKKTGRLDDIDEESETESTCPDEWEESIGVVAGDVANWDPEKQQGDPEDLVREGTRKSSDHHEPYSLLTFYLQTWALLRQA
jgi:centromere protein C